jgi:hypothetical protein
MGTQPARLGRRRALLLFLAVAAIHAISPGVQIGDSRLSVPTAYAVLHHGSLDLDGVPGIDSALADTDYDVVRRDGRTLPLYPWPPMLLAVPGVAVAQVAGVDVRSLRPSAPNRTWPVEAPTAALLVAAATLVIALLVLDLTPDHPRKVRYAVTVALVFAFGTAAWSTASRALWQHTPALLCTSLALLAAVRAREDRRYLWLLGAALGAGFTMRPTVAVALAVLGVWSVVACRRDAWRVVVAGLVVAVPFVAVNLAEYGSVLTPYYAGGRALGSEAMIGFGESLLVQTVSPSRGLFVYTPLFLLAPVGLWLRRRALSSLDVAVAVTVVLHLLTVARYGSTSGSSYGARFFTEAVPFLLYLCLPVFERAWLVRDLPRRAAYAVTALTTLSVLFAASGALDRSAYCWSATPRFVDTHRGRLWDWGDPQIARPVRDLARGRSLRAVVVGACDDR